MADWQKQQQKTTSNLNLNSQNIAWFGVKLHFSGFAISSHLSRRGKVMYSIPRVHCLPVTMSIYIIIMQRGPRETTQINNEGGHYKCIFAQSSSSLLSHIYLYRYPIPCSCSTRLLMSLFWMTMPINCMCPNMRIRIEFPPNTYSFVIYSQ